MWSAALGRLLISVTHRPANATIASSLPVVRYGKSLAQHSRGRSSAQAITSRGMRSGGRLINSWPKAAQAILAAKGNLLKVAYALVMKPASSFCWASLTGPGQYQRWLSRLLTPVYSFAARAKVLRDQIVTSAAPATKPRRPRPDLSSVVMLFPIPRP